MNAFVSYCREDSAVVNPLVNDLRKLGHEVWVDKLLYGGQEWWDEILQRIADCDFFVLALSPNSLASTPCQIELEYADELRRPFLPIVVERVNPNFFPPQITHAQYVDYTNGDKEALMNLVGAVARLPAAPPLPDPLPPRPTMPEAPLYEVSKQLDAEYLDRRAQVGLLDDLEQLALKPKLKSDVIDLLVSFRSRVDIIADIRDRVDEALLRLRTGSVGGTQQQQTNSAPGHTSPKAHPREAPSTKVSPPPEPPKVASPDNRAPSRVAVLDPLRRRSGLFLLCVAAVFASASAAFAAAAWWFYFDNYGLGGLNDTAGYLYAISWSFVAIALICGATWARRATGARPGDRTVLIIGACAAALQAGAAVLGTVSHGFQNFNVAQVMTALSDATFGILVLALAVRYRSYRGGKARRTPAAPLAIGGVSVLVFLYSDIFGTSWLEGSFDRTAADILIAVALLGIAIALIVTALLRLGPAIRLVVAAVGLIMVMVGASAHWDDYPGRAHHLARMHGIEAIGYLVISAVLLASALLILARKSAATLR